MITVEVYDEADIVMNYCVYGGQPAANFPFNFQLIDCNYENFLIFITILIDLK
jgi:hypothetical protein